MDRSDAFDVITDPDLTSRTSNLKRAFALKLAAQVVHDKWYSYEDPVALQKAIREGEFRPEDELRDLLLEYSAAIDAETLHVLRDVGVGSPQIGAIGIGSDVKKPAQGEAAAPPARRGIFGR